MESNAQAHITSLSKTLPLAVTGVGMITSVGMDTLSSCAAIRAAIDNFEQTRFVDDSGEWIIGSKIPFCKPDTGTRRLAVILASAIGEAVALGGVSLQETPVLVCLSEVERAGRPGALGNRVYFETQAELNSSFHPASAIIEHGKCGPLVALHQAHKLIYRDGHTAVLIAGVDSLLSAAVIRRYQDLDRLLTSRQSDGFIPGEASGVILIRAPVLGETGLMCTGLGFGQEQATLGSGRPLRADGLTAALKMAFEAAETAMDNMDFRIVDLTGEQYCFKETSLVVSRLLRARKSELPLWHVTDCVGEVGAAIVPVSIGYLKGAFERGFAPGSRAYLHASNDDSRRAAAVFEYGEFI